MRHHKRSIITVSNKSGWAYCTIFKIFEVEEYRDLEIQVRGHSP